MDYDEIMMRAEERMENALEALGNAFASVRTGRANARVLDRIKVDYYGAMTPINQLAGVKTLDKAIEIQSDYVKTAFEGYVAQVTKIGELYAAIAKDAYKPFEGIVAKAVPTPAK